MSEICFGNKGDKCYALNEKVCNGCNFYKPKTVAIAELEATPLFSVDAELQSIKAAYESSTMEV